MSSEYFFSEIVSSRCFYPMVGANASKVGSWTRAKVERCHREAASLQTHHVGTAGSAFLHITQV